VVAIDADGRVLAIHGRQLILAPCCGRIREYAGGPDLLPRPELLNGHLALRFHRAPAAQDLEYRVEMSADMRTWRDAGPEVEDLTFTQFPAHPAAALYRVTQPASQSPIRFLRVRLVRTQP
jgi:hypothetical protein